MSRLLAGLLGGMYRDEAADGSGGGAAGAAGVEVPAAGGEVKADDKGAVEGAKPAGESLVAEAQRLAQGAAQTQIPDKYVVKAADGKVDHEATARKVAAAHKELETRLGASGGMAPATADDYKLELATGEKEVPKLDAKLGKMFKDSAKAADLNQKQYNAMVRAGNQIIAESVKGLGLPDGAAARASLVAHYGSEAKYKEAAGRAFQGFAAFASEADMAEIDTIGDNPVFIRIFDRIAAELGEDKLPSFNPSVGAAEDAEIERLTKDTKSEYWDPKKPGHEAAGRKVAAWHEKQAAKGKGRFAA